MIENRVREFRERREMTQVDLAVAIEVSRQTIHAIENQKVVPTVEIAIKIAEKMKTRVEVLFFIPKNKTKRMLTRSSFNKLGN